MQDNTQNNWRGLLENADNFPNGTLQNKNETWEKLYARLHKKPVNKLQGWYWMAAACLLVIVISVFLFINKQKSDAALVTRGTSPHSNLVTEIAKQSILTGGNNGKTVLTTRQPGKSFSVSHKKINSVKETKIITNGSLNLDSSHNAFPKTAVISNPHFDSSIAVTVSATPAKKKLRVVHINEIGQPAEESTANKYTGKYGFEFRIINNEVYNPSATPVNNGLILFRSRTTSN